MKRFFKTLFDYLFSSKATLVLFFILLISMAAATFIEDKYDTITAKLLIYNAKWFDVLMLLLVLNFIGHIKRYQLFRKEKLPGLIFHSAFIVMLIGAGITRYSGSRGDMRIRQGESSNVYYDSENKKVELPFSIHLNKFIIEKYPGSNIPSSITSEITLTDKRNGLSKEHKIFINNVLDYDGYRFFQESYKKDETGTILSVNHDFYGTWVTYLGYFIMLVGFTLTLFNKNSRYWDLIRNIGRMQIERKEGNGSSDG